MREVQTLITQKTLRSLCAFGGGGQYPTLALVWMFYTLPGSTRPSVLAEGKFMLVKFTILADMQCLHKGHRCSGVSGKRLGLSI